MSKIKWHSEYMAHAPLHYTLVTSEEEWKKLCRYLKVLPPPFLGTAHATTTQFENAEGNIVAVVAMLISEDETQDLALLVHEAVHVWQAICKEIGEKKPSCEFEAYSIQTISYTLFNEYKEKRDEATKQAKVQRASEAKQKEEQLVDEVPC